MKYKINTYLAMALVILLPMIINIGIMSGDINYELMMNLSSISLLYGINFYFEIGTGQKSKQWSLILLMTAIVIMALDFTALFGYYGVPFIGLLALNIVAVFAKINKKDE